MVEFYRRRKSKGRKDGKTFMEEDSVYDKRDISPWRLWSIVTSEKVEYETKRYELYLYRGILEVDSKVKICST